MMWATGEIRRIDDLGRIVIPKVIRKSLFNSEAEGMAMEFYCEKDGAIIIKPYKPQPIYFKNSTISGGGMMGRLTERNENGAVYIAKAGLESCLAVCEEVYACFLCPINAAFNKLAEYEDLEEQYGLPKFHIGQVVYSINFMNEIEEEKVSMITQKADRSFKYRLSSGGSVWEATEEKAGRLFFITREEAEAKLKELEAPKEMCGATGLECIHCNAGACDNRRVSK